MPAWNVGVVTGYELTGSFLHIRTPEEFEKISRISMLV